MKIVSIILFFAFLMVACSQEKDIIQPKITITPIESVRSFYFIGDSIPLKVEFTAIGLSSEPTCIWKSSNDTIATVDKHGIVTAHREGKVTISVVAPELKLSSSLEIVIYLIEATSIKVDSANLELLVGDRFTLKTDIQPENTTCKIVKWVSSDTTIATVENGKVNAISVGEAYITASIGNLKSQCKVKVNPIRVSGVTSSPITIAYPNKIYTGVANITPANATNKTVAWSSSNIKVATIDQFGVIKTLTPGTTTITVTTQDGGFKDQFILTVKPILVKRIIVTPNVGVPPTIIAGEKLQYSWKIYPDDATNKNIKVTNSNPNVASWDNITKTITGIIAGDHYDNKTLLTFSSEDGNCTYSQEVLIVDLMKMCWFYIFSQTPDGRFEGTNQNGYVTTNFSVSLITYLNGPSFPSNLKYGIRAFNAPAPQLFPPNSFGHYKVDLKSVYRPIIVVKFDYNGKEYLYEQEFYPERYGIK